MSSTYILQVWSNTSVLVSVTHFMIWAGRPQERGIKSPIILVLHSRFKNICSQDQHEDIGARYI